MLSPKTLKLLANLLILTGILGLLILFSPLLTTELRYRLQTHRSSPPTLIPKSKKEVEKTTPNPPLQLIKPASWDFGILIPKIFVNSPVVTNVDFYNPDSYRPALKKGVAHAKGSSLPGQPGRIFLFAHSTDSPLHFKQYNAVFYLLYKLQPGDAVYLFYQNRRYQYKVVDRQLLTPNQLEKLLAASPSTELLTLQTCWPPGTTLKRLVVNAIPAP